MMRFRKTISLLLVLCLVMAMLPTQTLAASANGFEAMPLAGEESNTITLDGESIETQLPTETGSSTDGLKEKIALTAVEEREENGSEKPPAISVNTENDSNHLAEGLAVYNAANGNYMQIEVAGQIICTSSTEVVPVVRLLEYTENIEINATFYEKLDKTYFTESVTLLADWSFKSANFELDIGNSGTISTFQAGGEKSRVTVSLKRMDLVENEDGQTDIQFVNYTCVFDIQVVEPQLSGDLEAMTCAALLECINLYPNSLTQGKTVNDIIRPILVDADRDKNYIGSTKATVEHWIKSSAGNCKVINISGADYYTFSGNGKVYTVVNTILKNPSEIDAYCKKYGTDVLIGYGSCGFNALVAAEAKSYHAIVFNTGGIGDKTLRNYLSDYAANYRGRDWYKIYCNRALRWNANTFCGAEQVYLIGTSSTETNSLPALLASKGNYNPSISLNAVQQQISFNSMVFGTSKGGEFLSFDDKRFFLGGDGDDDLLGSSSFVMKTFEEHRDDLILDVATNYPDSYSIIGSLVWDACKWLNELLKAHGELQTFIGGKGDDVIRGFGLNEQYIYTAGSGHDTIIDRFGNDRVYLYGYGGGANCSVTVNQSQELNQFEIVVNGDTVMTFKNCLEGQGNIKIYAVNELGSVLKETVYRQNASNTKVYNGRFSCPVNVEIFDSDHRLVLSLIDGEEMELETEYGFFSVKAQENGEYSKEFCLYDESYSVKAIGLSDGYMKYSAIVYALDNEQSEVIDMLSLSEIPVTQNSTFQITDGFTSASLNADWNGDGIIDETIGSCKSIDVSETELTLSLGEQFKLEAETDTNSTYSSIKWVSLDESIASVDEEGIVTATGFGTASILAISTDGRCQTALCTVEVPQEEVSASMFSIDGVLAAYQYTGDAIEPDLRISYKNLSLTEGEDYIVAYEDNIGIGSANIIIKGCGLFNGVANVSFAIDGNLINVQHRVHEIAAECRAQGLTDEYEIALWLHDWIIFHANYDYSYTYYDSDGVLLYGTGVCQSYANAFRTLLNEMGIENMVVASAEMDHAWNLVKIGGEWCHIDCTWDDPGEGGAENHTYFGMNDDLLARDHTWSRTNYASGTSLKNYYPIRNGELVFANDNELDAILVPQFTSQRESVTIQYIGVDPEVTAFSAFEEWYSNNNWKYGIRGFSSTFGKYICTIHDIIYTEPWTQPENKLAQPVDAPVFSMNSPNGNFSLDNCRGNGLVLIFGREGCLNTRGLLQRLQAELDSLHNNGIEVLISVEAAESDSDIQPVKEDYPSFQYCYEQQGLLSAYLEAVDYYNTNNTGWVTYPCVFIINGEGKITYYSTGYVSNLDELVSEAFATSNLNPLPTPTENQYPTADTGDANLSDVRDGNVKRALEAVCANSTGVFFLTDSDLYYNDRLMMEKWEKDYAYFDSLGLSFVACFDKLAEEDRQNYPNIIFVEYDKNDPFFWDLLDAVGWDFSVPAYYQCTYYLEHDGHIADYRNGGTLSIWDKVASLNTVSVEKVELEKTTLVLTEGSSETLIATITPSNATNQNVTWQSSDASVATVSDGKVTAVKAGMAIITITTVDGNKTATCAITVTVAVTGIALDKSEATLTVGDTETLTATVTPENATNKVVTWTSSNPDIATVANGVVTAKAAGSALITAATEDGRFEATCNITVDSRTVAVTGIVLDKSAVTLAVGDTETLTATVTPENAMNKAVTWTSSNPNIAAVADGVVTAKAVGSALITVTAEDGGFEATCEITVTRSTVAVTGITLDKSEVMLTVGDTATLTATIVPENATNKAVTWASSDTSVATVANGVVTAKAVGTTTITATAADDSGVEAICTITVRKDTSGDISNNVQLISLAPVVPDSNGNGRYTGQIVCPANLEGRNTTVIVAFYSSNGQLTKTWLDTCVLQNGRIIEMGGQLPMKGSQAAYTSMKVFILENGSMRPLLQSNT